MAGWFAEMLSSLALWAFTVLVWVVILAALLWFIRWALGINGALSWLRHLNEEILELRKRVSLLEMQLEHTRREADEAGSASPPDEPLPQG